MGTGAAAAGSTELEAESFRRIYPEIYYQEFLNQSVRPDGRPFALPRPISFGLDVVSTADASALVKLGSSTALAGIKCEVMSPSDDRPGEGAATVTVELAPLCSLTTRPGRPSEVAAVLTEQLTASLAAPGLLDRGQLCIDAGKAAWAVYIDVYVLDDDGSLLDVCTAATVAALSTLSLPSVAVDEAGNVQPAPAGATAEENSASRAADGSDGKSRAAFAIRLGRLPTSLTCALRRNGELIVDPTAEEESLADALITTTVDDDRMVLGVLKPGGAVGTTPEQFRQCYEAAVARSRQLGEALTKALHKRQQQQQAEEMQHS